MSAAVVAARELVERLLGDRASEVVVEELRTSAPGGSFEVVAEAGVLTLRGTDGVAVGAALRFYLAHACSVQVTWDSDPVRLPDPLPDLSVVRRDSPWEYRYHLNFCTFTYSTPYWGWERWEREIDWMALHGVTHPLTIVGFEWVWLQVLQQFGLSSRRAREYIGSAVTAPFTWMGVVHHLGEPLSEEWIDRQRRLAHRILQRQRSLGMRPVLPGFSGYVPDGIATRETSKIWWHDRTENTLLDPQDPVFYEFGRALLAVQHAEFGSDGFYAVDPFVEGVPPRGDAESVGAFGRVVSRTLRDHDPRARWVLMGWPFWLVGDFWTPERLDAFLQQMSPEHALVLDFWAEHVPVWESTESFAGRPWLWCMLGSLGARPGLHGQLELLATEPERVRRTPGSGVRGLGTTTEAIDRDPVVYELMSDVAWSDGPVELGPWLDEYARARYGTDDERARTAWRTLAATVYGRSTLSGPPESIVLARPSLSGSLRPTVGVTSQSDPAIARADLPALVGAWRRLVGVGRDHGVTGGLARDLVELGCDILALLARDSFEAALAAFAARDREDFGRARDEFGRRLTRMDDLAATRRDSMLGTWLLDARASVSDPGEKSAREREAKRLVTTWLEPGTSLEDYSGRYWAGLVSTYYLPRWGLWFDALEAAWDEADAVDPEVFEETLCRFEAAWIERAEDFAASPRGHVIEVAGDVEAELASVRG